jgi:hypothetical protein
VGNGASSMEKLFEDEFPKSYTSPNNIRVIKNEIGGTCAIQGGYGYFMQNIS